MIRRKGHRLEYIQFDDRQKGKLLGIYSNPVTDVGGRVVVGCKN